MFFGNLETKWKEMASEILHFFLRRAFTVALPWFQRLIPLITPDFFKKTCRAYLNLSNKKERWLSPNENIYSRTNNNNHAKLIRPCWCVSLCCTAFFWILHVYKVIVTLGPVVVVLSWTVGVTVVQTLQIPNEPNGREWLRCCCSYADWHPTLCLSVANC